MAKGQKRSNREVKKPKKTAAERTAGTGATTRLMATMDKASKDKPKKR